MIEKHDGARGAFDVDGRRQLVDRLPWRRVRHCHVGTWNDQRPAVFWTDIVQHEHGGDEQWRLRVLEGGAAVEILVQRLGIAVLLRYDGLEGVDQEVAAERLRQQLLEHRRSLHVRRVELEGSLEHRAFIEQCRDELRVRAGRGGV